MATTIRLAISNITNSSATVLLTLFGRPMSEGTLTLSLGTDTVATGTTDSNGQCTFTGLLAGTTYRVIYDDGTEYAEETFITLPKVVQLQDKAGSNIYPIVLDDGKATITMTDTDPGEGVALQPNHFIAVYGDATRIQTADIANNAVTSDKIDWTTMPRLVFAGTRDTITPAASSFTKVPFTSSSIVYDSSHASVSNGIVTLQPGRYYITISCRWGDVSTNNNACLGFCVNGVTTDVTDTNCLWSFTNQRLSQSFGRVYDVSTSTTFQGLAWTAVSVACKSVFFTVIRIA